MFVQSAHHVSGKAVKRGVRVFEASHSAFVVKDVVVAAVRVIRLGNSSVTYQVGIFRDLPSSTVRGLP
jgi:hypothetical protein